MTKNPPDRKSVSETWALVESMGNVINVEFSSEKIDVMLNKMFINLNGEQGTFQLQNFFHCDVRRRTG